MHALKLRNVPRAVCYNHSNWLEPYIMLNTKLRSKAKNEFGKDLFKLTNSSAFGKMMENVREHRDIKLVVTEKKREKLTSQPNLAKSFQNFLKQ